MYSPLNVALSFLGSIRDIPMASLCVFEHYGELSFSAPVFFFVGYTTLYLVCLCQRNEKKETVVLTLVLTVHKCKIRKRKNGADKCSRRGKAKNWAQEENHHHREHYLLWYQGEANKIKKGSSILRRRE